MHPRDCIVHTWTAGEQGPCPICDFPRENSRGLLKEALYLLRSYQERREDFQISAGEKTLVERIDRYFKGNPRGGKA
jgi:hypothetical protein